MDDNSPTNPPFPAKFSPADWKKWQKIEIELMGRPFSVLQIKDPDQLLNHLLEKGPNHPDVLDERIPYWAEIWPSSLGLSNYLLEYAGDLTGKKVLEIGCGLGLTGMVAASLGAEVCISDYITDALGPACQMWTLNGLAYPNFRQMDWRYPLPELAADLVLASDVVYESRNYQPLLDALPSLMLHEAQVLLSEPQRSFSRDFFSHLPTNLNLQKRKTLPVTWQEKSHQIDIYEITQLG